MQEVWSQHYCYDIMAPALAAHAVAAVSLAPEMLCTLTTYCAASRRMSCPFWYSSHMHLVSSSADIPPDAKDPRMK